MKYLSLSVVWSCLGTLRLVTSALHLGFAFGKALATVTLVGRLNCLALCFFLPPSFLHPLGPRPIAQLQLPPSLRFQPPQLAPYCSPPQWSVFGHPTKTRLGYVFPPGHCQCRLGTPTGDPSPASPPFTFSSCHQAGLRPPAPLCCPGPYSHFLAQPNTGYLSDVIVLSQGFLHLLCFYTFCSTCR